MLVTGIERSCLGAAARDTERKAYSEELSSQDRGVMKGMGSGCLVMSTAAAAAVPSNSSSDYSLQL